MTYIDNSAFIDVDHFITQCPREDSGFDVSCSLGSHCASSYTTNDLISSGIHRSLLTEADLELFNALTGGTSSVPPGVDTRAADGRWASPHSDNGVVIHDTGQPARKLPKMIKEYILGPVIGEGTCGKVREGIHALTLQRVAVKVMKKRNLKKVKGSLKNIETEIMIMRQLACNSDPNRTDHVLGLREVIRGEGKISIVMDIALGSVQHLMDCQYRHCLPLPVARTIFHQMMLGLQYIHSRSIVHKDIKPSNLMIMPDGMVKISDFGVAEVLCTYVQSVSCVRTHGTPSYQCPQIASGQEYFDGFKSDVWSAGITLYHCVTGRLPFTAKSLFSLYENISKEDVPWEDVPEECLQLLNGMLAKNEQMRWGVNDTLRHPWVAMTGIPILAMPPSPSESQAAAAASSSSSSTTKARASSSSSSSSSSTRVPPVSTSSSSSSTSSTAPALATSPGMDPQQQPQELLAIWCPDSAPFLKQFSPFHNANPIPSGMGGMRQSPSVSSDIVPFHRTFSGASMSSFPASEDCIMRSKRSDGELDKQIDVTRLGLMSKGLGMMGNAAIPSSLTESGSYGNQGRSLISRDLRFGRVEALKTTRTGGLGGISSSSLAPSSLPPPLTSLVGGQSHHPPAAAQTFLSSAGGTPTHSTPNQILSFVEPGPSLRRRLSASIPLPPRQTTASGGIMMTGLNHSGHHHFGGASSFGAVMGGGGSSAGASAGGLLAGALQQQQQPNTTFSSLLSQSLSLQPPMMGATGGGGGGVSLGSSLPPSAPSYSQFSHSLRFATAGGASRDIAASLGTESYISATPSSSVSTVMMMEGPAWFSPWQAQQNYSTSYAQYLMSSTGGDPEATSEQEVFERAAKTAEIRAQMIERLEAGGCVHLTKEQHLQRLEDPVGGASSSSSVSVVSGSGGGAVSNNPTSIGSTAGPTGTSSSSSSSSSSGTGGNDISATVTAPSGVALNTSGGVSGGGAAGGVTSSTSSNSVSGTGMVAGGPSGGAIGTSASLIRSGVCCGGSVAAGVGSGAPLVVIMCRESCLRRRGQTYQYLSNAVGHLCSDSRERPPPRPVVTGAGLSPPQSITNERSSMDSGGIRSSTGAPGLVTPTTGPAAQAAGAGPSASLSSHVTGSASLPPVVSTATSSGGQQPILSSPFNTTAASGEGGIGTGVSPSDKTQSALLTTSNVGAASVAPSAAVSPSPTTTTSIAAPTATQQQPAAAAAPAPPPSLPFCCLM